MVNFSERQLRHRRKEYGDWSNIASDLLENIEEMLPLPDILRCRSVCRSWRYVTKTHLLSLLKPPPPPSPPLFFWRKYYSSDEVNRLFIHELKTDDGGNLKLAPLENHNFEQLLAGMDRCVGYSHGYFLFSDRKRYDERRIYLFHPTLFSGTLVRLPLIRFPARIYNYMIEKAIFWADPISGVNNNGSYGIVVIEEGFKKLFFAKCGATEFRRLEWQSEVDGNMVDIICIRNRIYGITSGLYGSKHYIKAWDSSNTRTIENRGVPLMVLNFKPRFSSACDPTCVRGTNLRLVELQGELFLVATRYESNHSEYNKIEPMFKVYKMDFKKKKWVRMISLGDYVLFITKYQSMFLSSCEFPQYERNSIYFSDYFLARPEQRRLAVFSMEDGSIKLIEAKRKY